MTNGPAIVVDGTAALPPDLLCDLSITSMPLHVQFGAQSFTAGVDLSDAEFYARLRTQGHSLGARLAGGATCELTTSAPTLEEARAALERAAAEGDGNVLVVTAAHELSQAFATCMGAAARIPRATIEVIDSRGIAAQSALIATACARSRRNGASFGAIVEEARRLAGSINLLVAIDTLEQLRRSGRTSSIQALLGTILSVKPLVEVREGRLAMLEQVRSREAADARLKQLIEARLVPGAPVRMCTFHTDAPDRARAMGEWAQTRYRCVEYWSNEVGAAVAAHAGPGAVIVGFCTAANDLT